MSKDILHASGTLADAARPTRYRWVVAAIFFLIYTVAAADRANLGIALPFLRRQFAMTNAEAGALVSVFLIAYALAQLPSAWLIARFGVRRVMPVSMILTSVATALTGVAGSLFTLKLCRLALGFAEGPLPLGIAATINHWFPAKEKGTASGIFLSAVKFGPVITPILGAAIITAWGWQAIFLVFAVPGLLFSMIWYWMVADRPADSRAVNPAERELIDAAGPQAGTAPRIERTRAMPLLDRLTRVRSEAPLASARAVATSWNVYGCALGYCCQLGISSVMLAWIPTYLLTVKQFSVAGTGLVAAAPWVGAVVGNILGGWLSDRVFGKRRKPGMMFSAVATALMMGVLIRTPASPLLYGGLIFLAGVALSIGFSAYMVYPTSFVAKAQFPLANAIVNMGGQLGGAATPFVAGLLLDHYGWDPVFGFMSALSVLAFVILLTISEPMETEAARKR